jgi:hypothetical protein
VVLYEPKTISQTRRGQTEKKATWGEPRRKASSTLRTQNVIVIDKTRATKAQRDFVFQFLQLGSKRGTPDRMNACHVMNTCCPGSFQDLRGLRGKGVLLLVRRVPGNQLFPRKQASRHLAEIFHGETMNKSGAGYDIVSWMVGEKIYIGWLRRRGAPREMLDAC